jgi:hypothetical protein
MDGWHDHDTGKVELVECVFFFALSILTASLRGCKLVNLEPLDGVCQDILTSCNNALRDRLAVGCKFGSCSCLGVWKRDGKYGEWRLIGNEPSWVYMMMVRPRSSLLRRFFGFPFNTFIHSFVHSFNFPFIHSFIHALIHSLIHSFRLSTYGGSLISLQHFHSFIHSGSLPLVTVQLLFDTFLQKLCPHPS